MTDVRYTLVSDGSSDRGLLPILTWLLKQHLPHTAIQPVWADLRSLRDPPKKLSERIACAAELYPCDLLFVHRDAEKVPRDDRVGEISEALCQSGRQLPPTVCVVPVRMTEAWLLFDERAIRQASANPNGRQPLDLPDAVEALADPKAVLYEALRVASGLSRRRRKRLNVTRCAALVAGFINDFSPLRGLPAFAAMERDLGSITAKCPW